VSTRPPTTSKLEQLLSQVFAVPVSITVSERITPWSVLRCKLRAPRDGLPSSVIVKWLRDDPNGFRTDRAQVWTERAALEFLEGLGVGLAPRLIAADAESDVLILEDLAPRVALDVLLRADPDEAQLGLSTFARALGELHSSTVGYAPVYDAKRQTLGPFDPRSEHLRFLGTRWRETRRLVQGMGLAMPAAAEREMATLQHTLEEPGPFLALSNGDSGANNFLVDGEDGRIIDFEFAGFRHALTDIACLYVPGPMWITVGDAVSDGTERVYREALARGVPEAQDDRAFGFGLSIACLAMALERLHRLSRLDARPAGEPSRMQMISTIESAAGVAERHRTLPNLAGWLRLGAHSLRRRWPDTDVEFAKYPPYTPRTRFQMTLPSAQREPPSM
jgi:hypothetical protein